MLSNPQVGQVIWIVETHKEVWFTEKKDKLIKKGVISRVTDVQRQSLHSEEVLTQMGLNEKDVYNKENDIIEYIRKIVKEIATKHQVVEFFSVKENHTTGQKTFRVSSLEDKWYEYLHETEEEAEQYLKEQLELLKQNVG